MKATRKKLSSSAMEKMFQVVRKIDITTVIVHLVLISAGAFLALFLSNLHQTKTERSREVVMLEQLQQSLTDDIRNLEMSAEYRQATINGTKVLKEFLVNHHPWNDSMSRLFYQVSSTGMIFPHPGAFESLKSTGIDLVHNPDIRF